MLQASSFPVGATAEIGRVVDGVDALLVATDRAMIRGFLEIEQSARLESGRLKLRRSGTPPATLVSGAVKIFSDQSGEVRSQSGEGRDNEIAKKRVKVKVEVQAGLPPIRVDPERTAVAVALLLAALRDAHPAARLIFGLAPTGAAWTAAWSWRWETPVASR